MIAVPSNVQSSRQEALLYVFEDNLPVIKMIMKGRSPTMRHVSRTHRVALDWLFDRTNLVSKIQIKYIDTKNQLGETISTRLRRRGSHRKIETYDKSYCQDAVVRVVFNFSKPGEETLRKSRSMEISCLERGAIGAT